MTYGTYNIYASVKVQIENTSLMVILYSDFSVYIKISVAMATCGQTPGKSHLTYAYIDERTIKNH